MKLISCIRVFPKQNYSKGYKGFVAAKCELVAFDERPRRIASTNGAPAALVRVQMASESPPVTDYRIIIFGDIISIGHTTILGGVVQYLCFV